MRKFSICLLGILATTTMAFCEYEDLDLSENQTTEFEDNIADSQDVLAGKGEFPDFPDSDEGALPQSSPKNKKKSTDDEDQNEKSHHRDRVPQ